MKLAAKIFCLAVLVASTTFGQSTPTAPTGLTATATATGAALRWGSVSGANKYAVEVSLLQDFSSSEWSDGNLNSTSASATGLASNTTYYWRVQAIKGNNASPWSQRSSFKTLPPPTPPPGKPTNLKATPTATGASLSWGSATGATSYAVDVSTDKDYNSIVKSYAPTSTSQSVTDLESDKTYYWRVRAINAGGESDPATGSFKTLAQLPASPTGLTAVPTTTDAALSWNRVTGAKEYEWEVYDKDFLNQIDAGKTSTTNATVKKLSAATMYKWRVRATNDVGPGNWNSTGSFTTPVGKPSAPSSLSAIPTSNGVSLSWTGVPEAKKYDVRILESSTFTTVDSKTVTGTSATFTKLTSNISYYAQVSSVNDGGSSDWIQKEFRTSPPPPAPTVTLKEAATSVTFTFSVYTGASSYDVRVLEKKGNTTTEVGKGSTTDPTKPVTIDKLEPKTSYDYEATVALSAGQTSQAATGSFKTLDATTLPSAPRVAVKEAATSVTFTFSVYTGASSYDVRVLEKKGNTTTEVGKGSTTDPTKPVTIDKLEPKTSYDYEATVSLSAGQTSQAATGSFKTLDATTLPRAPEVSVQKTTNTAVFTFKPVTGATSYDVKLYDKQNNGTLQGSGSTNDATKPVIITGLKSKTKYYYDATVTVAGQPSAPTSDSFETSDGPSGGNAPEVSVRATSSTATFTFKEVKDATLYKVVIYDEAPHGNKKIVAIDSGSTNDVSKPVVISRLKSKTKYYYDATVIVARVESDPTSDSFETTDGTGGVSGPEVSVRTTSTTATFTFKEVRDAKMYKVVIYDKEPHGNNKAVPIDSGSTQSAANPVVISGLSGKSKYYYEATVNVGGVESDPTSGDFTTDDASTSVRAPEVNVQNTTNTAAFTFKAVTGATSYDVKLYDKQINPNATPIDRGSTTDATKPVTFSNLASKQKYYYEATVTVGTQTSQPTQGDFTTDEVPPSDVVSAPTGLRVTNVTAASASISWTGVGQGVRFEVEVSPGAIRDANASSPYALTSLSPGTQYTWSVRASKGNAASEWVAGPSFTTLGTPPPPPVEAPDPPASLQASTLTPTSAVLSWTGNVSGARFELQVSPAGIAESNAIAPYAAKSLAPSTRYTWYVRTTKGNVSSNWIQGPSFTTPAGQTSGVEALESGTVKTFALSQNYPNPFNPSTKIEFSLPAASNVRLSIYNALGTEVRNLVDGFYHAGRYLVTWDAAAFPSGVYFYRLQTQNSVVTKRLMLVR